MNNDVLGLNPNAVPVPSTSPVNAEPPAWAQGAIDSGTTYNGSAYSAPVGVMQVDPNAILTTMAAPAVDRKWILETFKAQLGNLRDLYKMEPTVEGEEAPIKAKAARMKLVNEMYDLVEAFRKEMNEEYDVLRLKILPDLMSEDDIRSVTLDGVGRVQLGSDIYASIPAPSRDKAYKWLRDHNYGDLIQETVNSSTFKSFAKEYQQNATEDTEPLPEDLFKVQPFLRVSIVKAGSKK